MTGDEALAIIVVGGLLALLIAGVVLMERTERRRRATWAQQYFHGGGLIRALMARWQHQARLTDQRPQRPADDGDTDA